MDGILDCPRRREAEKRVAHWLKKARLALFDGLHELIEGYEQRARECLARYRSERNDG